MRRFLALSALLGLLLGGISACRRHNDNNELRGKLILAAGCGNYVIQLQKGYLPPDRINTTWKDPLTDSVYTNVFTVANACSFNAAKLVLGDVISFRVDNSTPVPVQDCIFCAWYRPAPPANNIVLDTRKLN